MPPTPICAVTSYGPRRVPGGRAIWCGADYRRRDLAEGVCEFVRIKSSPAFGPARSCPTSVRRMRVSSREHSKINQLEGLAVAIPWGFESSLRHHLLIQSVAADSRRQREGV